MTVIKINLKCRVKTISFLIFVQFNQITYLGCVSVESLVSSMLLYVTVSWVYMMSKLQSQANVRRGDLLPPKSLPSFLR